MSLSSAGDGRSGECDGDEEDEEDDVVPGWGGGPAGDFDDEADD